MSTLLDYDLETAHDSTTHGDELRSTMAAVRVSLKWFGTRKSVSSLQKTEAARPFNAEGKFLSVGKKLIDTTHPAWKTVTGVRGTILGYWRDRSLPFPEDGIRLIKRQDIDTFNETMRRYQNELDEAVWRLNEHYDELKANAQQRLGRLFQESDYPTTLIGMFEVTWNYPNVEPPNYLQDYNPRLFREESQRVRSRFNEAVRLAEEAFTSELSKLVAHLIDKLSGDTDGKPKIFRDTAVTNLSEFFERFQRLSIGSNEELEQVVGQARQIMGNIPPQQLRDSATLRQQINGQLANVQSTLDQLMIDRPRRNLIRNRK